MRPQQVKVEREPYRDRRNFNPIEGVMEVEIEVCSRQKHNIESCLFVGSGEEELKYRREILERILSEGLDDNVLRKYVDQLIIRGRAFQRLLDPDRRERVQAIFGTSVKGNIKSRLQLTLQPNKGIVKACIYPLWRLSAPPRKGTHGWRHYRIWEESLQYIREGVCNVNIEKNVCIVCDLFGAPGLSSMIECGTFYMVEGSTKELVEGAEKLIVAMPGSKFRGSISFRGLRLEELGLLLIGMGYSIADGRSKPVLFGSHKYRGLGNNLMGRVVYNVISFGTSSRCEGQGIVGAGKKYEKEELEKVLSSALKAASEKFGPHIRQVDENAKALEVMRGG